MWRICYSLLAVALLTVVYAQEEPIYVPFNWNSIPLTASRVSISGATTTYVLIDGTRPGPATLIQSPGGGSITYVAPTSTFSGVCNLVSPVAVCTLNVYTTGRPLPSTGLPGKESLSGAYPAATDSKSNGSGAAGSSSWQGTLVVMGTVVLGFFVSVSFLR